MFIKTALTVAVLATTLVAVQPMTRANAETLVLTKNGRNHLV